MNADQLQAAYESYLRELPPGPTATTVALNPHNYGDLCDVLSEPHWRRKLHTHACGEIPSGLFALITIEDATAADWDKVREHRLLMKPTAAVKAFSWDLQMLTLKDFLECPKGCSWWESHGEGWRDAEGKFVESAELVKLNADKVAAEKLDEAVEIQLEYNNVKLLLPPQFLLRKDTLTDKPYIASLEVQAAVKAMPDEQAANFVVADWLYREHAKYLDEYWAQDTIRTVGTLGSYATILLAEAACVSGDTIQLLDTVADGVPSVYINQVMATGATIRTYTAIDDVLVYGYANTITLTSTGTLTLNNIRAISAGAYCCYFTNSGGGVTMNGCICIGSANGIMMAPGGNTISYTLNACVGVGNSAGHGIWFFSGVRTAVTAAINNCVGIAKGSGNGFMSTANPYGAGTTCALKNGWFWSVAGTDLVNTGTQATLTNCYSPDGTAGNTCTVANAKFKDLDGLHSRFGLPDVAILAGSSLIGAGADPGVTISDVFGTSKATGSGTFDVGACFYSVTTAPTQPTGCECVNWTGNVWNVHWDALVDKEHPIIKATVGGTAYYAYPAARTAPGNQRCQIGWTTDVTMARYLNLPTLGLTFSLAGVTAIAVASANVCEVASTYTTATVRTLAATGSVPVFAGITAFAQRSTGLQATWSSAITGTPTGFDVHIKPSAQIAAGEFTSEAYLVARVPFTGLRNQSYMTDISGNFFSAGVKYWGAVRARNAFGPDINTTQLSAYGSGGNVTLQTTVNNYTISLKAPILALNPL